MNEMKTYRQWMREGRTVKQGEKASAYLMDDLRVRGAALFTQEQTDPNGGVDEQDTWTQVATPEEFARIRAEANRLRKTPLVRIDAAHAGGVSVWVGPNRDAIGWLKESGYRYDNKSHRWLHKDKAPEYVAAGFATKDYRIVREFDGQTEPTRKGPAI